MSELFDAVMAWLSDFYLIAQEIIPGLGLTLQLFFWTAVLSMPLGLLITMGIISKIKPLRWFLEKYNWILRGTPLMLQVIFVYFGLPKILGINFDRFVAAVIAFSLNYAAYFSEIFRSGFLAIDKGQFEAAHALGLGKTKTLVHIIIPQMFRVVLPPVTNEIITLVKDTVLVTIIALPELLYKTNKIVMRDGNLFAFFVVAIIYLAITYIITKIAKILEKRINYANK